MVSGMEQTYVWMYAAVGALFGLAIGSAVNALVWRLKVGKSWVHGRSECPECGHRLSPADLVPVVSWVTLGGKCRYCRKPIADHPWVELAGAAVFAVSAYVAAPTSLAGWASLGVWLVAATMLLALAVYDLRWMLLPDKLTYPLMGVALAGDVVLAAMTGHWQVVIGPVEAAALAGGAFWLLVVGSGGRAMGGGDVKLAAAMGLLLGVKLTLVALVVAFWVAAAVGVALIATGRRKRKDHIPFGPFLVLGTMVAQWWGLAVIAWYLRLNGLG